MEEKLAQLEQRISQLEQDNTVSKFDNEIYLTIKNLTDLIEVVSTVPTATPKAFYDQVKIYISGGTYRLYVYNYVNNVWRYVTLT